MSYQLPLRAKKRSLPLGLLALTLSVGCANVTVPEEDSDMRGDEDMGSDSDLDDGSGGNLTGSGGASSGSGGSLVGSGGSLVGSGGSLVGSGGMVGVGGMGSGGAGVGGTVGSGGAAGSGGSVSSGGASGDMCDAAEWQNGGVYAKNDQVTRDCPTSGLGNGHECYGYSGKHWFYCEGDAYQCGAYDPAGTVAHGVWQINSTPCP